MSELLRVDHLEKRFSSVGKKTSKRWFAPPNLHWLHAVDDVSLEIQAGESVGLVGESGCGKSTLCRVVARLTDSNEGTIWFDGKDIGNITPGEFARNSARAGIQMVFQDSTTSLNPRFKVSEILEEPLIVLSHMQDAKARAARVAELAEQVGLPQELITRYPHQLSGGQKARVNIARALASKPKLIILDEPTAALDVSVQAIILKLLDQLRRDTGVSYLFISHDLNLVRLICDRVMVMYLGKIVEVGPAQALFAAPKHPYTAELVSAIPQLGKPLSASVSGEPQSPIDPNPTQCRFFGRCARAQALCGESQPALQKISDEYRVACHFPL